MNRFRTNLAELNMNDKKILGVIFWHQQINPKGIRSNELRRQIPIHGSMNDTAFLKHLKKLQELRLIEREESKSEGGQIQVFYRLNKDIFNLMYSEHEAKFYDVSKKEVELFLESIKNIETDKYTESIMEFLLGRLILTAFNALIQEDEMIRGAIYFDMWEKTKDLLEGIRSKTRRDNEEKKKAYDTLLELLEPYSDRSIGKQVMLNKLYDSLKKIDF